MPTNDPYNAYRSGPAYMTVTHHRSSVLDGS